MCPELVYFGMLLHAKQRTTRHAGTFQIRRDCPCCFEMEPVRVAVAPFARDRKGGRIATITNEGAWRRGARARAQGPRSVARRVPLGGGTAESPAAGGRQRGV